MPEKRQTNAVYTKTKVRDVVANAIGLLTNVVDGWRNVCFCVAQLVLGGRNVGDVEANAGDAEAYVKDMWANGYVSGRNAGNVPENVAMRGRNVANVEANGSAAEANVNVCFFQWSFRFSRSRVS